MISPGHIQTLSNAGLSPTIVDYFFNQPKALIGIGANGALVTTSDVEQVRLRYPRASIGYFFNSFGRNAATGAPGIEQTLTSDSLPAGITYIQYDPEDGVRNGTPQNESAALEAGDTSYVAQAAALAHQHGLLFIFTPSVDVGMTASESAYPMKYTTWLKQDRGAWAAIPGVDLYSIQSQQAEGTPIFTSFVPAALAQAQLAALLTPIDIGIGINPNNPPTAITTAEIISAFRIGQTNGAAGYWNNVETGAGANVPAAVYVKFFQQLYADLGPPP